MAGGRGIGVGRGSAGVGATGEATEIPGMVGVASPRWKSLGSEHARDTTTSKRGRRRRMAFDLFVDIAAFFFG
jgi:hypothetical protein